MDATTTVNTIDQSAWKTRFEEASTRIQDGVQSLWQGLARDPERLRRLQAILIVVLVLWSLSSVSQLIWIPFRTNPIEVAPALALNPPKPTGGKQAAVIDTSGVLGLGLFGGSPEAFADADSAALTEASRDGIEQNAQETRLALTLTGIVASTEDGSGSAVIKSGAAEQVYAVGDALPASGQVVLAKVMPQQVVIDNNGTYELMKLYEGPGISIPTRTARAPRQDAAASLHLLCISCGASLAVHNVYIVQFFFPSTERGQTYLKISVLSYHSTYIFPSSFDRGEIGEKLISLTLKL